MTEVIERKGCFILILINNNTGIIQQVNNQLSKMHKDFEKQILEGHFKEDQKLDPFVYVTPELSQFVNMTTREINSNFIAAYVASNVILAPLQTIITSLQLSVQKHKNIFQTQEARSKQLARLNTQMTIHDKRKFELMIRAGGKTTPYVAPVYGGYRETIQGLQSQGWKAFYKGLAWRSFTTYSHFYPFLFYSSFINQQDVKRGVLYENLKIFGFCTLIDIFFNPLYLMEYRHILQNRIPEFRSIYRPIKYLGRIIKQGQGIRGLGFHITNNFIGLFTRLPIYLSLISGQGVYNPIMYPIYIAGQVLAYPILTAYKRLQCQTQRYVGMIPVRYSGLFHAIRVIWYEEGSKGLWRAFPLHLVQNLLRIEFIGLFTRKKNLTE